MSKESRAVADNNHTTERKWSRIINKRKDNNLQEDPCEDDCWSNTAEIGVWGGGHVDEDEVEVCANEVEGSESDSVSEESSSNELFEVFSNESWALASSDCTRSEISF